jgi:hypothetical protein
MEGALTRWDVIANMSKDVWADLSWKHESESIGTQGGFIGLGTNRGVWVLQPPQPELRPVCPNPPTSRLAVPAKQRDYYSVYFMVVLWTWRNQLPPCSISVLCCTSLRVDEHNLDTSLNAGQRRSLHCSSSALDLPPPPLSAPLPPPAAAEAAVASSWRDPRLQRSLHRQRR